MEKHLKLFSTDSARTTYESSANYETPYVSKVIADNSVHYNKVVQLITFKINTIQYQAENGMTWGDWVNSEYNINNTYSISNDNYVHKGDEFVSDSGLYVVASDIIITQKYLSVTLYIPPS